MPTSGLDRDMSNLGPASDLKEFLQRIKRIKETARLEQGDGLEHGDELKPDDPSIESLVRDMKQLSGATEMDLVSEDLGDSVVINVIGRAMREVPFPALKTLEMGGNYISDKGVQAIATAMEAGQLPALETLGFFPPRKRVDRIRFVKPQESMWSCNHIGDEGLKYLVLAFKAGHGQSLKVLSLELNKISAEGAKTLAEAIRGGHLPCLEMLNLSYNSLGDDGIVALARALDKGRLTTLKVLELYRCNISMEGVKALAVAFNSGYLLELRELYLGKNNGVLLSRSNSHFAMETGWTRGLRDPTNQTDEGFIALAKVLQEGHLPKIETLDLSENAEGKRSAEAFRDALRINRSLTVEIKIAWRSHASSARRFLERNKRIAQMVEQFRGEEDMEANSGKIFLCGHAREGKTTLRKSLQKEYTFPSLHRERRHHEEPRTRGIEVSQIIDLGDRSAGEIPVTVSIWDLAGQHEYQILHSAFLPDLAFADGQATTFVIVCKARYSTHSEEVLNYWMRFIASSALKGAKRHVVMVLNCFNDERCAYINDWKTSLKRLEKTFRDYLEIVKTPFVVDARVARSVKVLKEHLMADTRRRLRNKRVPRICQQVRETISHEMKNSAFPVKTWNEFILKFGGLVAHEDKLKGAVAYLHEAGHLIHFPEGSLSENRNLLVLDPDWFCRRVVGHLLLPEGMLDNDETPINNRVRRDGLIAFRDINTHFKRILHSPRQVQDVVAILLRLGICYKVGNDNVLIPALIKDGEIPAGWVLQTPAQFVKDQWVMGYSLTVTNITMLPIAVFRRLQVELAQDPVFSQPDSDYTSGKFFITFKYTGMAVLVEISVNERDSQKDRVDILVRPLVNSSQDSMSAKDRRGRQVDLAETIVDKVVYLAETWSPGAEFARHVVKPWSTAEGTLPMKDRDISMTVDKVKQRVLESGLDASMNWIVVNELVMAIQLLPVKELEDWRNSCALVEKAIVALGLIPEENYGSVDDEDRRDVSKVGEQTVEQMELSTLIQRSTIYITDVVREELERLMKKVNARLDDVMNIMGDIRNKLGLALRRQEEILVKLQSLERFAIQEKEQSVPRFIYLTKSDSSGMWRMFRDVVLETSTLHFLCEASFYHDQSVHEVKDQPGWELRGLKPWAKKIAPWVNWSLRVAFVLGKVASQAILPGLGQLISTFPQGHHQATEASIDTAIAYLISAGLLGAAEFSDFVAPIEVQDRLRSSDGVPIRPVQANDNLRSVLQDLIGELSKSLFLEKFKLQRATLNDNGYVLWICTDCCSKYGRSVTLV